VLIEDGIDLNFTDSGDVPQKEILKLTALRPPLNARLLPDDQYNEALLLYHATCSGVAPVVGFFLDTGDGYQMVARDREIPRACETVGKD
jgi:hypothetical protein